MTSYLDGGWYAPGTRSRLRTEVIDGAMDAAGMLLRAGVPTRRVLRLALKVRTLIVIADPLMRGTSRFGARERMTIAQRLTVYTDDYPELQGFVNDCIQRVHGAPDMTAFYLHLVHVTRMMQLLDHAMHRSIADLTGGLGGFGPEPAKKAGKAAQKKGRKAAKKTRKAAKKKNRSAAKKTRKAAKKRTNHRTARKH